MISSYQDALRFLYDNLPMFQRVGAAAIRKDLTNTLKLCALLGDPQHKFKSIHVAGTNGKGSICHMLASVLQEAGYRTGLYTSPHLKAFTERIRVDGQEVAQSYVLDFVNRIRPAIEEIRPSFFEITVAMAFDYFARQSVEVAVVETGLGGRLDSTNVITPVVSVITNISWDHKDVLGDTLEQIAREKAGIVKKKVPVVISERQETLDAIFIDRADTEGAPLFFASDEYTAGEDEATGALLVRKEGEVVLSVTDFPLRGQYQRHNVPAVVKVVDVLRANYRIDQDHLEKGLRNVVGNTGLKGRWQILQRRPMVVCDTAHNLGGMRQVVEQLHRYRFSRLFIVLGMVKDKDIREVLSIMPSEAVYYFCEANLPRAMDACQLQEEAAKAGLRGQVIRDVNEAKAEALKQAQEDDFVLIGGSTYVVAELEDL